MENIQKKEALLALGSPTDIEKLLDQIKPILDSDKRMNYVNLRLSGASAHRTPDKARAHAKEREYDLAFVGAGLANHLQGAQYENVGHDKLFIGVPISDSSSGGLSSLFSTQEMPPGCPVGCVGIDRLYVALDIGLDLLTKRYEKVFVMHEPLLSGKENIEKCMKKLDSFGIEGEHKQLNSPWETYVKNNPEYLNNALILYTYESPAFMNCLDVLVSENKKSSGLVIASILPGYFKGKGREANFVHYAESLGTYQRTMHVRINGLENMATLAAKIIAYSTGNEDMKKKIEEDFQKGVDKYANFKSTFLLDSSSAVDAVKALCKQNKR